MHKWLLNECHIRLTVLVPGRLQVAAPREAAERDKPGNLTQVVRENGHLYIPGSSLKGVFRQRAEYIANLVNQTGLGSCHLFDSDLHQPTDDTEAYYRLACGYRFNIRQQAYEAGKHPFTMAQRFKDACPACQMFGHTLYAGHLRVTDFTAIDEERTTQLPHIALDRITNSVATRVSGAKASNSGQLFTNEYVTQTCFTGNLILTNFTLWQIGWLSYLLRDLQDGLIRIGHKRTSGAGQVEIQDTIVTLRQLPTPANDFVNGVGRYLSPEQRLAYGFAEEAPISISKLKWQRDHQWHTTILSPKQQQLLWQATRPLASAYLQQFDYPEAMTIPFLNELLQKHNEEVSHA